LKIVSEELNEIMKSNKAIVVQSKFI